MSVSKMEKKREENNKGSVLMFLLPVPTPLISTKPPCLRRDWRAYALVGDGLGQESEGKSVAYVERGFVICGCLHKYFFEKNSSIIFLFLKVIWAPFFFLPSLHPSY